MLVRWLKIEFNYEIMEIQFIYWKKSDVSSSTTKNDIESTLRASKHIYRISSVEMRSKHFDTTVFTTEKIINQTCGNFYIYSGVKNWNAFSEQVYYKSISYNINILPT